MDRNSNSFGGSEQLTRPRSSSAQRASRGMTASASSGSPASPSRSRDAANVNGGGSPPLLHLYRSPSLKSAHPLISSNSLYGEGLRSTSASPRSSSASRSRSNGGGVSPLPNQETFDRLHEDAVIYNSKLAVKRDFYEQQRTIAIESEKFTLRKQTFSNPSTPRSGAVSIPIPSGGSFASGFASPLSPESNGGRSRGNSSSKGYGSGLDSPRSPASASGKGQVRRYGSKEEAYTALHLGLSPKNNDKYRAKMHQIEVDGQADLVFKPTLFAPKSAQLVPKFRAEQDNQFKNMLNIDIVEYGQNDEWVSQQHSRKSSSTSTDNSPNKQYNNKMSLKDMSSPETQKLSSPSPSSSSSPRQSQSPSSVPTGAYWNVLNQFATGSGSGFGSGSGSKEPGGSKSAAGNHLENNTSGSNASNNNTDVASEIDVSNQTNINNSRVGGVIVSNSAVYQHSVADEYFNLKLSQRNKQQERSTSDLDLTNFAISSPKNRSNNQHQQSVSISTSNFNSPHQSNMHASPVSSPLNSSNSAIFSYRPLGPGGAYIKSPKTKGEIVQGRI